MQLGKKVQHNFHKCSLFNKESDMHARVRTIRYRVSVSGRCWQYRHRTDTEKVSFPILGLQGAGCLAAIDTCCIALTQLNSTGRY